MSVFDKSNVLFAFVPDLEVLWRTSSANTGYMNMYQGDAACTTNAVSITGTASGTYDGTYTYKDNLGQGGTARYQRGSDSAWIIRDSANAYWGIHTSGTAPSYFDFQYYNTTGNLQGTFTSIPAGTNATATVCAPFVGTLTNYGSGYGFLVTSGTAEYRFDGSNDYVALQYIGGTTIPNFSYFGWIKTSATSGCIYSLYKSTTRSIGIDLASGALRVIISDDGNYNATHTKHYQTNGTINDGNYHSICVDFKGSTSTLTIYVDGVAVAVTKTYDAAISSVQGNNTASHIGALNGAGGYFNGYMKLGVMHNASLTSAQISNLHSLGYDLGTFKAWNLGSGLMQIGNTFAYTAGTGGTLTGTTPQDVALGANGTEVTAVADSGYSFEKWSDDVMTAARTDTNSLGTDLSVSASFVADPVTPTGSNRRKSKYFNGFPSWSQRKKNLR